MRLYEARLGITWCHHQRRCSLQVPAGSGHDGVSRPLAAALSLTILRQRLYAWCRRSGLRTRTGELGCASVTAVTEVVAMLCSVCGAPAQNNTPHYFDGVVVRCAHSREYEIPGTVLNQLLRLTPAERIEVLQTAKNTRGQECARP